MNFETRNHFETESASIVDLRCPGIDTRCGSEEVSETHHLVFVRRGAYHNFRGSQKILADARQALFYNAGESYRVSHPCGGDECTMLTYTSGAIADVLTGLDAGNQWQPERPFPFSHGPADSAAVLRCHQLRHRIRLGLATSLEVEETGLGILAAVARAALRARSARRDGGYPAPARRRKELVDAARRMLAGCRRSQSLTSLARALECSPYHLTRIFRAEIGVPLYQYQLWVRLYLALDRLADGEENLSALAHEVGFSSHSHFTTSFGRALGLTPSEFRRWAGPERSEGACRPMQA